MSSRDALGPTEEENASWLYRQREQLLGQRRMGPQRQPDWCTLPPAAFKGEATQDTRPYTQAVTGPGIRELEGHLAELLLLWDEHHYQRMRGAMEAVVDDLLATDTRAPIVYFFALGGVDLFLRFLCEPPHLPGEAPEVTGRGTTYPSKTKAYIATLNDVASVLTDVIICDSSLSWYIYDRYPCAFFRLLELMAIPDLCVACGTMLEQMVAQVGTVFEIAKTPLLIRLLRSPYDIVVTCSCRVAALLFMPTIPSATDDAYVRGEDMLVTYKRTQRVIDSNVLWIASEPELVERLIALSEVRTRSGVRVQDGRRAVAFMDTDFTADLPANGVQELEQLTAQAWRQALADAGAVRARTGPQVGAANTSTGNDNAGGGSADGHGAGSSNRDPPTVSQLARHLATGFQGFLRMGDGSGEPGPTTQSATNEDAAAGEAVLGSLIMQELGLASGVLSGAVPADLPERVSLTRSSAASPLGPATFDAFHAAIDNDGANVMGTTATPAPEAGGAAAADGAGEDDEANWVDESAEDDDGDDEADDPRRYTGDIPAGDGHGEFPDADEGGGDEYDQGGEDGEDGEYYDEEEDGEYYDEEDGDVGFGAGGAVAWGDIGDVVDQARNMNAEEEETKVSVGWYAGAHSARYRWRQRDATLTRARDDNRFELFGHTTDTSKGRSFYQLNKDAMIALGVGKTATPTGYRKLESDHYVVNSQSEMLFLLTTLLCTFYFSEPWEKMREARWLQRSVGIFDATFGQAEGMPVLVDVMPEVHLTQRERRLPRFLTFRRDRYREDGAGEKGEVTSKPPAQEACTATTEPDLSAPLWKEPAVGQRPSWLKDYVMPSIKEIYDGTQVAYAHWGAYEDPVIWYDKDGAQGPDTIRKIELLKGILEFWNAQDRGECEMLQSEEIVKPAACIAKKVCQLVLSEKECANVEDSAFVLLQFYVRSFTFAHGTERCGPTTPQTEIGKRLLAYLLKHRIYNAVRIPSLPGSIAPRARLDAMNGLICELLMYHYDNLRLLCHYVRGTFDLSALNKKGSGRAGGTGGGGTQPHALIRSQEQEEVARILAEPPLDREAHEPFASVLLRRMHRYGSDSQLIVRALLLSMTPGLRSKHNYITKHRGVPLVAMENVSLPRTEVQDLITGTTRRLRYISTLTRATTTHLSLLLFEKNKDQQGKGRAAASEAVQTEVGDAVADMLGKLIDAPGRLTLANRPYPNIVDADDMNLVRGLVEPAEAGTRDDWALPLFGSNITDEAGLRSLTPLSDFFLGEPHKLIFSMVRVYDAERIAEIDHLPSVTTTLLLFVRVAKLHGVVDGVRMVLQDLRPLATAEYDGWRRGPSPGEFQLPQLDAGCTCDLPPDVYVESREDGVTYRCANFVSYGACSPESESQVYFRHLGGCFFRNYFRLLCFWLGHYVACQRFVGMLFYYTGAGFGEVKSLCLYLLRELPYYFQDPILKLRK